MGNDEVDARCETTVSQQEMELERAVDAYALAKQEGNALSVERFVAEYPHIADRLRACLAGLAAADDVAEKLGNQLAREPSIPQRLGDFHIQREIGRGGMGEVYRAEQLSLNRPVALKVLPRNWGWTPELRKRFHREAQAAAKLHHTNIVAVYAEGEEQGVCYYAMELIEGPSLDRVIADLRLEGHTASPSSEQTGSPSPADSNTTEQGAPGDTVQSSAVGKSARQRFDTFANWIAAIADALDYAHQQGVIHRDVKPSNLMVGKDGRVRLTDFGLARMSEEPGMTITGELLGTPRYMSPEQVTAGRMAVDARTDIYSLGATLYELVTLHPPFPGKNRDQIIAQIISKDPKPPRSIDSAIPLDLETICLKALEKDVSRRYQTVAELAQDLRRYVDRYAISAKRTGPVGKLVKWAKRRPGVAALAAGLVVAATVAAWQGFKANQEASVRLAQQAAHARQIKSERLEHAKHRALAEAMIGDATRAEEAVREAELLGAAPGWVRLLEGQIAHAQGNLVEAKSHLEQAVRLMPESVAGWALLARASVVAGSYETGQRLRPKIESLDPKTPEDFIFLGYYYSVFEPARALETLDTAIARRDSSVARLIRVDALSNLVQLGDVSVVDRAIRDAEAAYSMLPNNQLALAKCIEAHTASMNAFAIAKDEHSRQKHDARAAELVATVPPEAIDQLHFHVACYWDRKGNQPQQALRAWRRAARSGWARSVKHYISELYRQKRFDEALQACDLARTGSDVTNIEVIRVLLLAETDQKELAEEELERLAAHPEITTQMKAYLALVGHTLGRNEWSDELMRQAEPPENPLERAFVDYDANRIPATELLAVAADDPNPYLAALQSGDAHFHMAHRALAEKKRDLAIREFRQMEDLNAYYFYEYRWSRAFRERLESDLAWPASLHLTD